MNRRNIYSLLDRDRTARLLDLGCDDGALTVEIAARIGKATIYGAEIVHEAAEAAGKRGVLVKGFDLNGALEFAHDFFDVVHANQVIEHVHNSDNFIGEVRRILRPGGYAVISTENASSWCNVFASVMGWQIFSLTNFSNKKRGIGNPLALYRNGASELNSWNHVRIYSIRGLREYFEAFGFIVEGVKGAGYFPLPSALGNIDRMHSHFITFKIRKPLAK